MAWRDYANARAQAARGRLLGPAGLRDLLSRETLSARLAFLRETDYGETLVEARLAAGGPVALREAERALGLRLLRDAHAVDAWLARDPARPLVRAFLAFEDAENLKVLLRALARGAPVEQALALALPTPGLDDQALRAVAGQPGPEALAAALAERGLDFGPALAAVLPEWRREGALSVLELALDRAALERGLRAAAEASAADDAFVLRHALAVRADAINAATLLKLDSAVTDPPSLFVAVARSSRVGRDPLSIAAWGFLGPALDRSTFARAVAQPPAERRSLVARLVGRRLGRGLLAPAAFQSPFRADALLRATLERALHLGARAHPLSVAVPLALLSERAGEVRRLRLALRCAEFGLPPEDVLDLLEAA